MRAIRAMKIATITCNAAVNYGARLQTYALQHYLQSLGHEVEIIDYQPEYVRFKTRQWYNPGLSLKAWAKLLLRWGQRRLDISKHARLEAFSADRLNLTRTYHSISELRDDPPLADMYVAGSDQIWNVTFPNGHDSAYYLDFGSASTRRISYAASFALPALPKADTAEVKAHIAEIDEISVREASAVDIIKDLGREATLVCDPVFLLTKDFWSEFAGEQHLDEDYVLIYDFERNDSLRQVATRIAHRKGLKVYSVSPWRMPWVYRNYCDCTPQMFVALFKNATCVVSNSLHGTIYSIIFQKDFFVVNRADGLNVRMSDLLSLLNLSHRTVTPAVDDATLEATIDYAAVDAVLQPLIQQSGAWLMSQCQRAQATAFRVRQDAALPHRSEPISQ